MNMAMDDYNRIVWLVIKMHVAHVTFLLHVGDLTSVVPTWQQQIPVKYDSTWLTYPMVKIFHVSLR